MKNRERVIWIIIICLLVVVTTASGLNHWIFAGNSEKTYEQLRIFNEIFNLLRTEYYDENKVTPEHLIPGAIKGMIDTLDDPHTSYMSKEIFNELQTDTKGEFGGLGIVIGVRDKWITVIAPIDDTPAARAGIKAGDKIIEIDGKSTEGYTTMDAVKLLRGQVGASVTITVQREEGEMPLHFTIVRGIIKLETVKSTVIDGHIGYIRISQFSEPTGRALEQQLNDLLGKGIDSLIVDLRNNPGGLLPSVIEISDMFLSSGGIVSTRGRDESQNQVFTAHSQTIVPDIPLIVLINGGSASASEIFSGAIRDNNRGTLLGEKTFGKGSVQTVRELPDGSGIRITTALYYTPSGESIDKIGIEPDQIVEEIKPTKDELKAIDKLNELELINTFVSEHKSYTESDLKNFMNTLEKNGLKIRQIIVKRLIKNEHEKNIIPSLIDLDYDVQLKSAVKMLESVNTFNKAKAS